MPRALDLLGKRFGRLVVVGEAEPTFTSGGNRKRMVYCNCDCGKENLIVAVGSLRSGSSKSCGCYNKECIAKRMSDRRRAYNEYDLSGTYGIGYTQKGEEFYFDLEDYDKIKDYCWYKHREYIEAKIRGTDKHVAIHKIIMNDVENNYDVDHIDTNKKYDNRKCNLRLTSRHNNSFNHKISKSNTSGATGVFWHTRDSLWVATIKYNGKCIHLGSFHDFDEAVKKRKEAEEIYFGAFSYDNSQKLAIKNNEEN